MVAHLETEQRSGRHEKNPSRDLFHWPLVAQRTNIELIHTTFLVCGYYASVPRKNPVRFPPQGHFYFYTPFQSLKICPPLNYPRSIPAPSRISRTDSRSRFSIAVWMSSCSVELNSLQNGAAVMSRLPRCLPCPNFFFSIPSSA